MALADGYAGSQLIPTRAGIGLRHEHRDELPSCRDDICWLEAHSENYFADGGTELASLLRLRELYPLSLHGVGLSLGSTDPLDREHLRLLKRLVDVSQPAFVSEHLSWGSVAGQHFNDLLPLPYTEATLLHMVDRVGQVQDYLDRQILIENISSYLRYRSADLSEPEFLVLLAERSGCGLLLDVNNVYVNARNFEFDPYAYLAAIPASAVRELHLAGHSVNRHDNREILIDTHSTRVDAEVWRLFEFAIQQWGALPTLIEWDADIPALEVLIAEAALANARLKGR